MEPVVAGLAAAIRAAAAGREVTVIEQASEPGGKLREEQHGAYRFDVGPSLFTWPELVLELDELARGAVPNSPALPPPFAYRQLDRSTHYFWEDGTRLTAWSDSERFAQECADKLEVNASIVANHLAHSTQSFHATRAYFSGAKPARVEWQFKWEMVCRSAVCSPAALARDVAFVEPQATERTAFGAAF